MTGGIDKFFNEGEDGLNKYEGLIIVDASAKEDALKAAIDKVQDAIKATGGKVLNVQKMDQRAFARPNPKRQAGYYVNIIFDAPSNAVADMDAKFHLEGGLVRWQFTRRPEPSKYPKRKRKPTEEIVSTR